MENTEQPEISENPMFQLLLLLGFWFGGAILGSIFVVAIGQALGIGDIQNLLGQFKEGQFLDKVPSVKFLLSVSHLFFFALPALFFAYFLFRPKHYNYLLANQFPKVKSLLIALPMTLLTLPLVQVFFALNMSVLPEGYFTKENMELQNILLQMNSVGDLVSNLILVGIIAGLGEELLFRGVLQRILAKISKNIHVAVWFTAILFSLVHGELQAFLPRMLLGALLGYALIWTGNLWVPIIMHIGFNSSQVLAQYFSEENLADIDPQTMEYPHWAATLITTVLAGALAYLLIKTNKDRQLTAANYVYDLPSK